MFDSRGKGAVRVPEEVIHRGIKIQRHRRRWRWRVRDGHGFRVGSGATVMEAQRLLDRFLDARARREARLSVRRERRLTIADLCDQWFAYKHPQLAPATAQQYAIHIRVHIKPLLGRSDASAIRPNELETFYASNRWKPAKESHNILRQAFDWALRNDLLAREANPCLVVRPSRRACVDHDGFYDVNDRLPAIDQKQIPSRSDIEKLLVDAEQRHDAPWWLYVKLASATGARPGEICALRRQDIDLERHTLRIEWSADRVSGRIKRPKTPWSVRTLHLGSELFEAIASALPNDPDAFLFPSNTNRGSRSPLPCWNSRSVKRRLDAAIDRQGVRHFTGHAFRHYVATHLLDQGWPPLQVARFLGHANDALVRTLYANHIVDETQRLIGEAAGRLV